MVACPGSCGCWPSGSALAALRSDSPTTLICRGASMAAIPLLPLWGDVKTPHQDPWRCCQNVVRVGSGWLYFRVNGAGSILDMAGTYLRRGLIPRPRKGQQRPCEPRVDSERAQGAVSLDGHSKVTSTGIATAGARSGE